MRYEDSLDEYHPRPLLPTDEEELNSQLERKISASKKKIKQHRPIPPPPQVLPKSTRFNIPTEEYDNEDYENENDAYHYHNDLSMSKRSASNRNMNDLLFMSKNKPAPTQKALTDTNNFIEIFNQNNNSNKDNYNNDSHIDDITENHAISDDQISLGSIDNTMPVHPPPPQPISENNVHQLLSHITKVDDTEEGMTIDLSLKKRKDEWAERGAAKITKEVINPLTGEKSKKIIKKGIKDFKFGDEIGDGAYSTVMLATAIDSGKKYAVKVLNKEYLIKQKKVKYVNIEKNALQRVNNSNSIIKLYFTFQDENSLYFLLEYAPNGDFLSLLKKYGSLNETAVQYYSAQIIDAIGFLHSKGIIHRDMKPENILLDSDWKVKLTDFGTAKILERSTTNKKYDLLTRSKSFVGTAEYVSPELLNDSYVDFRCDIWAFGCIVFQMIAGKPPFKATNEYLTFQKVMKVQYAFTAGFPTVIRDLVKRILIKPIDQRLTIPQIEKHHFYKSINFKDGSVWSNPVPELSAYKMTAKSMQPIPALKGPMIYKRPQLPSTSRKSTGAITPGQSSKEASQSRNVSTSNIQLVSTSGHHVSNSPTPHTPSTPVQTSLPLHISTSDRPSSSRKQPDERTTAILENAKKGVDSRKQLLNKRSASGSSHLALNLSSRKNSESAGSLPVSHPISSTTPVSYNRKHSNSGPSSSTSSIPSTPLEKPNKKPDQETTITSPGLSSRGSYSPNVSRPNSRTSSNRRINHKDSTSTLNKTSNFSENIQTQTIKEQSKIFSGSSKSNSPHIPTQVGMNKQDIQWSFYLKSIQEHVLQVQEMYMTVIDSELIEKKLAKHNRALTEPLEFNHGRSTLLSQVARSGGDVTGFRYSDSHPPEDQYYSSSFVDEGALIEEYRYHFEFVHLLMSDENDESTSSEPPLSPIISGEHGATEDSHSNALSGKFKKFLQQAKSGGLLDANTLHERFQKRTIVITSYGRLLVFTRNLAVNKSTPKFELIFDINLLQIGVDIKEILMSSPQNNMVVVDTPYNAFVLCSTSNTLTSNNSTNSGNIKAWFKVIKKSMYLANDQKKSIHTEISPHLSVAKEPSLHNKMPTKSTKLSNKPRPAKISSPMLTKNEKKMMSPNLNDEKHSMSSSIKNSGNNRGSRMFSSYVSAKEKQHKKHNASPIPTTSKLVSGLPSTSASALLGLGLNTNSHSDKKSSSSSPSPIPSSSTKSSKSHSKFGFRY